MPPKLNAEIINAAIEGFESQKRKIDFQIAELRQMLDGHNTDAADATSEAAPRKRKHFSAASRKKMALAQKARWAKIKGESEPPAATPAAPKPKRRKMSAAGRQAIADATRKRWEAFHAAKAQEEKTARRATRKKGPVARKKAATKKTAAAPATATA
jgi:hypothetical protein